MIEPNILEKITSSSEVEALDGLNELADTDQIEESEAQIIVDLLAPFLKATSIEVKTTANETFAKLKRDFPFVQYPQELLDSKFIADKVRKTEIQAIPKPPSGPEKANLQEGIESDSSQETENEPWLKIEKLITSADEGQIFKGIKSCEGHTNGTESHLCRIIDLLSKTLSHVNPQIRMCSRKVIGEIQQKNKSATKLQEKIEVVLVNQATGHSTKSFSDSAKNSSGPQDKANYEDRYSNSTAHSRPTSSVVSSKEGKSRQVRMAAILATAGLFAYIFATFYWWAPSYTLRLIRESFTNHDIALFNKCVDVDTVISRLIDDSIEEGKRRNPAEVNEKQFSSVLGQGLVAAMKGKLASIIKSQIEKYIETGRIEEEGQGNNKLSLRMFMGKVGEMGSVKYERIEGKIAIVGIELFNSKLQIKQTLEIKLRKGEEVTWKVVEIANLPQFLAEAKKRENELIDELNVSIRKRLAEILAFKSATFEEDPDISRASKRIIIKVTFENTENKNIAGFSGRIKFSNNSGKVLKFIKINTHTSIDMNKTKEVSWIALDSDIYENDSPLFDIPISEFVPEVILDRVEFSDRTEISIKTSLT